VKTYWVLVVALGLVACDDGGGSERAADGQVADGAVDRAVQPDARVADARVRDASVDAAAPDAGDAALDAAPDAEVGDAAWLPLDPALLPPPAAPLRAGVAVRRMPVPLGIGTSGYGPSQADPYDTPFQDSYPGTQHIHLHPDFRVVVLEAGENNRIILIRLDTVGVSARIRQDLVARLSARYGGDIDRQLIIAATHTHSGPGRLIDKPLWRVIQDTFWPEFYARVLDTLEATVVAAMDDLEPARIGHGTALTTAVHSDRRCANPEETEPEFPVLRIDRADGTLKGLVLFHTVHGTALSMRDYALSQDVTGAIEAKVAEAWDDPIFVMYFNGAAADMSVGSPDYARESEAAPWPSAFTRTEVVGRAAAEAVVPLVPTIETRPDAVLHSRVARVPLNRDVLRYPQGFFPYPFGAVYCGAAYDERCVEEAPYSNGELLRLCVPFPDEQNAAPTQAPITVGQIDDLAFITTPGEFSISLGRRAREAAAAALGLQVVVIGYAQEYTGYSLEEDDWWHGGYEASGALWGPRQGAWLADSLISLARSYADPRIPLSFADQAPPAAHAPTPFEPRAPLRSLAAPGVLSDVAPEVGLAELATFTFAGGDPWLGNPVVTLEQLVEGVYQPVHVGGVPVTSDGYVITLSLQPVPPYSEAADVREYRWTAEIPAVRTFGGGPALRDGTFRLVARGRAAVGVAAPEDYGIASQPFHVAP